MMWERWLAVILSVLISLGIVMTTRTSCECPCGGIRLPDKNMTVIHEQF